MAIFGCDCKRNCALTALIFSAIVGVLTAFLQITGVITVTTTFLQVVFAIGVVYLGLLVAASVLTRRTVTPECTCETLRQLLFAILGSITAAVILLAVGIVATSILNAILVGVLLFFFALMLSGTACYVRCLNGCEN